MRSFASSFLCVFVFFAFAFFAFSFFFCVFVFFLRLRSLNYASSFSEICVFVLWNMRLRSSAKRKRCQLSSGEYCKWFIIPLRFTIIWIASSLRHDKESSICLNLKDGTGIRGANAYHYQCSVFISFCRNARSLWVVCNCCKILTAAKLTKVKMKCHLVCLT